MSYRFLEDIATADVAFEAVAASLEELFIAAAEATMNVMVHDLRDIVERTEVTVILENNDLDMLLFNLLQELLFYKDARHLLLKVTRLEIFEGEEGFRLVAACRGEEIDTNRHKLIVDVKAVTLHMFLVEKTEQGWRARVILDI